MNRPITPAHACAPAEPASDEARGYEVVFHAGPLPQLGQSELSPAEVAFRAALEEASSGKSPYARWALKKRTEWMSARGLKVGA